MPKRSYYRTNDLPCAAYLLYVGCKLENIDNSNPRQVQFVFDALSKSRAEAELYYSDRMQVNPRKFYNSMKWLKFKIHEANGTAFPRKTDGTVEEQPMK